MFDEDDLLPISGLSQLAYCPRRWGLMHLEGLWRDNLFTVEGDQAHKRVHAAGDQTKGQVIEARGLRLRCLRWGLTGVADLVEFHPSLPSDPDPGAALPGRAGRWRPFPVEYKRGKPKPDLSDQVQLCGQALCLEEMLGVQVPAGALYYHQPRRRVEVAIDSPLRQATQDLAARLHQLARAGLTPPPQYGPKCRGCSLVDLCLPKALSKPRAVAGYLERVLSASDSEGREQEP